MKKVYRISKEFIEVRDKHGRHVDPIDAYVNATAHGPEIIEEYTNRTEVKYWDKQIIIRDGTTKNKIIIATIRNGIEILQHKRIDHVIRQV